MQPTDLTTRRLDTDDWPEALRLGIEGFGNSRPDEPPASWPPEGMTCWGTFQDEGAGERMVARLAGRHLHSWFDGVAVPTLGVAGVTVQAEHRGRGLLDPLFRSLLTDTDAPLSTLYPTAPGIYRRFGYEVVGVLRQVEVPTADLSGVRPAEGITTRRATKDDATAITGCYTRWAAAQNGPLTRTGPLFDPLDAITAFTGATLAEDADGACRGYLLWSRGSGYGASSTIDVHDLVADSADAARALWSLLASFGSVTGQVRLWTSGDDVTRLVLPSAAWREVHSNPYMLRVHDVARAFSLRTAPTQLAADLTFGVRGDRMGRLDGDYRLSVRDGAVQCTGTDDSAGDAARVYTPAGLALAYAGAQSSANLRLAGLLTGPSTDDAVWDALLGGRQFHVRDYF